MTISKARVFVINVPLKKNDETGELFRWLPMDSLPEYGEVIEVLPPGNPPAHTDGYLSLLKKALADFAETDYLVLVGDQSLLVAAAAIVGFSQEGKLRLLKWERRQARYAPVTLNFGIT